MFIIFLKKKSRNKKFFFIKISNKNKKFIEKRTAYVFFVSFFTGKFLSGKVSLVVKTVLFQPYCALSVFLNIANFILKSCRVLCRKSRFVENVG